MNLEQYMLLEKAIAILKKALRKNEKL